ncbi:MAG: hypothetical protein V9H69_19045 [Anaerolineae bacterium]
MAGHLQRLRVGDRAVHVQTDDDGQEKQQRAQRPAPRHDDQPADASQHPPQPNADHQQHQQQHAVAHQATQLLDPPAGQRALARRQHGQQRHHPQQNQNQPPDFALAQDSQVDLRAFLFVLGIAAFSGHDGWGRVSFAA